MMRCLALAKAGICSVAPNPMVGSVIVHHDRIIGEGYHQRCGEVHAEVNAVSSVKDKYLLRDATLYVNLEPCSHYGKTPPCAEMIIREGIPRVVIGTLDPFPEVSGRGVRMLQDAGIEVVVGVMEEEAKALNRFFLKAYTLQRPYVILKWAQSRDGFIDRIRTDASDQPVHFSTPSSLRSLHKLRSEVSAIMVGTHTVLLDNPSLTVRHWVGNSPVRVVLDRSLRIPVSYHLFDGSVRTLVFTEQIAKNRKQIEYIGIDFSEPVIPQVLHALFERKLNSLLVEGGATLHRSFFDSGLFDEIRVETAPIILSDGVKAPDVELIRSCTTGCIHEENVNENEGNTIEIYTC